MTQDEIIRMAREACSPHQILNTDLVFLERFAALVAAHVTETLTKSHEAAFQSYVDQAKADRELEALAARLDEREACADLCYKDKENNIVMTHGTGKRLDMQCAAAIRARGEK